jgi:hypothetical protein
MHWDWLVRGVEFVIVSGLAWKINRALNRFWDLFQEYPLHRHVGHRILYPRGMEPEATHELTDEAVTSKGRA